MLEDFLGGLKIPPDDLDEDDGDYFPDLFMLRVTHAMAPVVAEAVISHELFHEVAAKLDEWLEMDKIGDYSITPLFIHDKNLLTHLLNGFILDEEDSFDPPIKPEVIH